MMYYLRISLIFFVLGGMLCYFGWKERQLASTSGKEPTGISLKDLIARGPSGNAHVIVGNYAVADNFVYEEDGSSKRWKKVWVPIVPIEPGQKKEAGAAKNVQALLYSTHVKNEAEVNSTLAVPQISGMVINTIETLGSEEKKLLSESYPGTNFDRCLIIEEGREPASPVKQYAMLYGGAGVCLVGFVIVVWGLSRKQPVKP
jgi:hypothetical protein